MVVINEELFKIRLQRKDRMITVALIFFYKLTEHH